MLVKQGFEAKTNGCSEQPKDVIETRVRSRMRLSCKQRRLAKRNRLRGQQKRKEVVEWGAKVGHEAPEDVKQKHTIDQIVVRQTQEVSAADRDERGSKSKID